MGEETPHVAGPGAASARVVVLGAEATAARDRLDALVAELRRRRDDVMDWRTQLRRHRRGLTMVLGVVAAAAAAGFAVHIARRRRRSGLAARVAELTDKADRLQHALGRVVEDPARLTPIAPRKRRKGELVRDVLALAVPVARIVLPHIASALAPPSRGRATGDPPGSPTR